MTSNITIGPTSFIREVFVTPYLSLRFRRETPDTPTEEARWYRFHVVNPHTAGYRVFWVTFYIQQDNIPEDDVDLKVLKDLALWAVAEAFSKFWSVRTHAAQEIDDYRDCQARALDRMEKIGLDRFINIFELNQLIKEVGEELPHTVTNKDFHHA